MISSKRTKERLNTKNSRLILDESELEQPKVQTNVGVTDAKQATDKFVEFDYDMREQQAQSDSEDNSAKLSISLDQKIAMPTKKNNIREQKKDIAKLIFFICVIVSVVIAVVVFGILLSTGRQNEVSASLLTRYVENTAGNYRYNLMINYK